MRMEAYHWADPVQFGTLLFDLEADPHQAHPIENAAVESTMIAYLVRLMQANDAPPEQYERLGLTDKVTQMP